MVDELTASRRLVRAGNDRKSGAFFLAASHLEATVSANVDENTTDSATTKKEQRTKATWLKSSVTRLAD
jgi:hypothetical protein